MTPLRIDVEEWYGKTKKGLCVWFDNGALVVHRGIGLQLLRRARSEVGEMILGVHDVQTRVGFWRCDGSCGRKEVVDAE